MRISDWSSDVCSSDLHQSGRGSGDHGRARLRLLQHQRPPASARPMSNTAVLENALLPLRPLLAREDVTAPVINKAGQAAIETRDGWSGGTLPGIPENGRAACREGGGQQWVIQVGGR